MFYRLTDNLTLRSQWRPYRPRSGERVLVLRSPSVFPPGHPTTRLCLELLKEVLGARPVRGLLDVGCGSGILALAGAALGASFGVGVDLSWQAARVSRENAAANNLAPALTVVRGSTECLRGPYDLILANLPWAVQLDKVAEFSRLAAPGGALILSGFKDTQEPALEERYQGTAWSRRRRLAGEEWQIELPPEKSFTWVAWLLIGT
jgi:ribosomal protein L11 methyltransferase